MLKSASASVSSQPRDPRRVTRPLGKALISHSGLEEGGRRRAYLKVEAFKSWAELLSAGQTILLAAAGHAGEEAEQQEVTKQDFHGAGAEAGR